MDAQEHRMHCLKMAFELGGNADAVIAAAQRLHEFVAGPQPPTAEVTAIGTTEPAPEPFAETAEPLPADAISACGTALIIPEGGQLADAVPSPEAEPVHAALPAAAVVEVETAAAVTSDDSALLNAPATEPTHDAAPIDEISPPGDVAEVAVTGETAESSENAATDSHEVSPA